MKAKQKENIIEKEVYLSTPQIKVLRSRTSLTLNMAGQRAGKSFLIGFKSGYYISNFPKMKGMIAANTYKQLEQSTMSECKKVWKSIYNLTEFNEKNPTGNYVVNKKPPKHFHQFELFADYNGIISFENGAIVFIASLENYLAHDGKTLGWAELDETKDTREEALKAVILARLSQPGLYYHNNTMELEYIDYIPEKELKDYSPINPCCINTSPSIGVVKWLTDMFSLEDDEKEIFNKVTNPNDYFYKKNAHQTVVIFSTYWNAHNLVDNYIENRLSQLSEGEALKFVFGFPFGRSGASYYRNFNKANHVRNSAFMPESPIHLTYDFNAVPYMTQIACQVNPNERTKELEINIFKEYCLASPYNSTKSACEHFIQDFEGHHPSPYVYFYGDASGENRQAGSGDHSQFDTVREMLYKFISPRSDRVPKSNKGVFNRRNFIDRILERKLQIPYDGEIYTVTLYIDPSCVKTIEDFQWLKEGVDGKLKERVKDPETGASYEKLGHCSDAVEYLICELLEEYYS